MKQLPVSSLKVLCTGQNYVNLSELQPSNDSIYSILLIQLIFYSLHVNKLTDAGSQTITEGILKYCKCLEELR